MGRRYTTSGADANGVQADTGGAVTLNGGSVTVSGIGSFDLWVGAGSNDCGHERRRDDERRR